jgi:ribosomal protein S18 acetylase RimI-like enzyme
MSDSSAKMTSNVGGLKIVAAGVPDCELINALAWKVFPSTYEKILTPEQIDYMMDWMYSVDNLRKQMAEGHHYFIAYRLPENAAASSSSPGAATPLSSSDAASGKAYYGEACGYVSVEPEGDDLFHLQKIYVLPQFQKLHIGDALFDQAVSYVRSQHPQGPCRIELNVNRNNPARGFYEKRGMREVDHGDYPIGNGYYMNDYIMALDVIPEKQ